MVPYIILLVCKHPISPSKDVVQTTITGPWSIQVTKRKIDTRFMKDMMSKMISSDKVGQICL